MTSRLALISNLSKVEAAVSDTTAIPVLCQFWFTGKRLVAFNGIIGISVPCVTDFKGGVPKTLKKLLETSAAQEVELRDEKGALFVKAAASKFKLSIMPLDDFADYIKGQPELPPEPYKVNMPEFIEGLNMCMRSIGTEKVRADMMGVNVIRDKRTLLMFGHDIATVSFAEARGEMDAKRAIIPVEWCKQAVSLFKDAEAEIEITQNDCIIYSDDARLWASTVIPDSVEIDFVTDVLDKNLADAKFCAIPPKFPAAIERAAIIGKSGIARTKTELDIQDGGMAELFTSSEAGEVTDEILIKGHPAIKVTVDAVRAAEGVDLEDLYVTKQALVMSRDKGRLMYFVSLLDGNEHHDGDGEE